MEWSESRQGQSDFEDSMRLKSLAANDPPPSNLQHIDAFPFNQKTIESKTAALLFAAIVPANVLGCSRPGTS